MIAMSKPAFLAIAECLPTKPVIIFVPGRQQCRLTAEDLLVHCGADDDNVKLSVIQPHLDHISRLSPCVPAEPESAARFVHTVFLHAVVFVHHKTCT